MVNQVAAMLGGGGHPRAAGANLIGSLDFVTDRVLEAAESYMRLDYRPSQKR
jgi:nanoRNase/pAp phosphatase (c-di-AMP/oligoRNAs hydrolase)